MTTCSVSSLLSVLEAWEHACKFALRKDDRDEEDGRPLAGTDLLLPGDGSPWAVNDPTHPDFSKSVDLAKDS